MRPTTFKNVAISAAAAVLAALWVVVPIPPAGAATFTLTSCSSLRVLELWNAIVEANDEDAHPGPDTIELEQGCSYDITIPYPGSEYALPQITSAITIVGHSSTIRYLSSVDESGLFDVAAGAGLTVTGLTLINGEGIGTSGAYFHNAGDILVNNTDVGGFNRYLLRGPAVVNLSGANLTFNDVEASDLWGLTGTRAFIQNAGSLSIIGSTFSDLNEVHGTANTGILAPGRAFSNTGLMQVLGSRLSVTPHSVANDVQYGGGIANSGTLVIGDSQLSGFISPEDGAAIDNSGSLTTTTSSFVFNNEIADDGLGGAVHNTGIATFANSTFYGNNRGGAVYNGSIMSMNQVTADNQLIANASAQLAFTVARSILGYCTGSFTDGGSNLMLATRGCPGTPGNANLHVWNGSYPGKGLVLEPGTGSDAVDAASGCTSTDERGFGRPADATCDIGAFEDQAPAAPASLGLAAGSTDPGKSSTLGLDWPDAADPDFDALTYRVFAKDSDDSGFALVGTVNTSTITLTSLTAGTYDFKVEASDGNHTSAAVDLDDVVVDLAAPSSPAASPDRVADYVAGDGTEWWADQVVVSFSGSTDPALADGSAGSGVATYTGLQTLDTSGAQGVSGTATDAAGNVSAPTSATYHVDATTPVVGFSTCPSTAILGHAVQLRWTASDADSGLATQASGSVLVDTTTIGQRTLTTTAEDNVGHQATATCVIQVVYDFTGYFRPVGSGTNSASAGKVVTVSFGLAGDQGLGVLAAGYPLSAQVACNSTVAITSGTPTIAQRPLSYAGGRYTYLWSTDKAWKGTCRQLVIKLNDGTFHRATFAFK